MYHPIRTKHFFWGAKDRAMNKTGKIPILLELTIMWGKQTVNKLANQHIKCYK